MVSRIYVQKNVSTKENEFKNLPWKVQSQVIEKLVKMKLYKNHRLQSV